MSDAEMPDHATERPETELDFEAQYQALSDCVAALESGRLRLDDSLTAYQKGIGLVRTCRDLLNQAQARVELIEQLDPQGFLKTEALDLEVEAPAAMRSRTKKARPIEDPF